MKRPLATLLASTLCLVLPGCGKPVAATGPQVDMGSVWVVESPTTRLYLCGTIHLLRDKDYPLPPAYDKAYADSQRLVFELPPGSGKGSELATLMAKAGTIGDGRSLFDLVDKKTGEDFKTWAKKRSVNVDLISSFRPWFAALTIAATEYQAAGADATRGVDTFFEGKAAKDSKPGEGLESVKQQIDLFVGLSEVQQAELLSQTLAEVEALSGQFEDMVSSWRKGDIAALNRMLFEEAEKYPDLMDVFLYRRNESWIHALEKHLAGTEKVMVLVGAGHLGGDKGVVELLKKKGYRTWQFKAEAEASEGQSARQ